MTDRAGRWVTEQVGRRGRTVNEIAVELGCDWHTINDTVIAYGTPLVEDPARIGDTDALGLDETLFARIGPWATQHWSTSVVDVRRGQLLDELRRRVQDETLGHRGHKDDPLSRSRRLLTRASERLTDRGRTQLLGLLDAGDPRGEVRLAWHAKELVRSLYDHTDPDLALAMFIELGRDLQDETRPPEIRQLGRTITKWRHQIAAWHQAYVSNGPTEAANNLIKSVKRVAFGFTSFRNYRIRTLLYAGKPNWDLLATIAPR